MNSFCTLFDSNYLTRALAMYSSMAATGESFRLYALCLDDASYRICRERGLPGLVPISAEEFETPALKSVKKSRSKAEYCWTCASSVIRHVMDAYHLEEVTYLDADLYFFSRPSLLLEEFRASGASVLLTEHRFTPQWANDVRFGRFCVQFMTFKNDGRGRGALDWWIERCLEWCHARLEEGKFGDQKYLDDWLERFPGVHVSSHPGAGVANWNLQQYRLSGSAKTPLVDDAEVIFFHFHSLKVYRDGLCDLGYKPLPPEALELFYLPYLSKLRELERELAADLPGFCAGRLKNRHPLAHFISYLLRKPKGTYNVHRLL